ncbi:hypothetical protein CISG_02767 [Coccidioides immitis RMSCC 3703]|uniref:Uncharacterized protein n=1 Tax=Coccidioides immitis RMSCC 3703 TaxID=454286 RepID=A0A0J8R9K9_COCIT|nr:hypothetical protein CISG_02767 [Coccidioides immitis RMSCC 3703]
MAEAPAVPMGGAGLRERKIQASRTQEPSPPADSLMSKMRTDESSKIESEKKTFGRTPDGTEPQN